MRRTTIGLLAMGALVSGCGALVSGCGSTKTFANHPRPPIPVNLTVYVNDAKVSLSPSSVGAGPVNFIITNQASQAESLTIQSAGSGGTQLANTGPIDPQATAQVSVDFKPGDYTVTTGSQGSTDASLATTPATQSASLHVGPLRPSSSNILLQP